jgi:SAM-dependent methyltransferase
MTVFGQARRQNGRQAARAAAGHAEENLLDHPFPRQVLDQCGVEYGDFDHRYFDEPTVTGFSGYFAHGNGAEGPRDFSDEARRIAAIPGVRSVLDVGCAKGFLVRELRAVGVEAWGIDVSGYAISRADEDTRPWLSVGSLRDIGSGVRYDLCHVCGVLVYLRFSEIRETLRRLHRISRVGAVFFEPALETLVELYEAGDPKAVDPLRKQELPRQTWEALYREAGFEACGGWYRRVSPRRGRSRPAAGAAPPASALAIEREPRDEQNECPSRAESPRSDRPDACP